VREIYLRDNPGRRLGELSEYGGWDSKRDEERRDVDQKVQNIRLSK
jgi:hypothetical protein